MTNPDAFTSALQSLAAASTALEYTAHPSTKDMERARDKAKDAHEILDSALKLRKRGIYKVCDEPPADPPLFDGEGQPVAGAEVLELPPAEEPAPKHPLDLVDENGDFDITGHDRAFDDLLLKLENAGLDEGLKMKAWKKAREAWDQLWAAAGASSQWETECREVYDLAVFALEVRKPISWAVPTEQELIEHERRAAISDPEFDQAVGA